jgi:hypothetical protein
MIFRRKRLAAMAAITAALAVAVPAASASAATTTREVIYNPYALAPLCATVLVPALVPQISAAEATGNIVFANIISSQLSYLCPPA